MGIALFCLSLFAAIGGCIFYDWKTAADCEGFAHDFDFNAHNRERNGTWSGEAHGGWDDEID